MSYALSTFLVPRDQILRFPGCPDDKFLNKCLSVAQNRLADLDEQLCDEDDITHEQAFRELFSGSFTARFKGAHYGWAFETLCDCLGTSLSNRGFSPCKIAWYDELDNYLESAGIPLRFDHLVNNCPIDIPLSDDWPTIGHWSHQEIVDSANSISQLTTATRDPDILEALTTVAHWFNWATKDSRMFIVGFHG